jgi:hypothetical protein
MSGWAQGDIPLRAKPGRNKNAEQGRLVMEFWASSESYQPAGSGLEQARHCVEPYLNAAFAKSSLAGVEMKLRYVPIVMPVDMHERYSERSRALKKQRIYDCAPHLDYDLFVSGTLKQQLNEYLRGIALSAPHLHKFGLTPEQVGEFEQILASATERILEERPDQTRH